MATSDSPNEPPRSDSEGPSTEAESSSQPFLDRTSTHNAIFYILAGLCVGLFAGDALYHKHTHFEFEGWFGYYAFFGFFAAKKCPTLFGNPIVFVVVCFFLQRCVNYCRRAHKMLFIS